MTFSVVVGLAYVIRYYGLGLTENNLWGVSFLSWLLFVNVVCGGAIAVRSLLKPLPQASPFFAGWLIIQFLSDLLMWILSRLASNWATWIPIYFHLVPYELAARFMLWGNPVILVRCGCVILAY